VYVHVGKERRGEVRLTATRYCYHIQAAGCVFVDRKLESRTAHQTCHLNPKGSWR
jgi:hypothetical protein